MAIPVAVSVNRDRAAEENRLSLHASSSITRGLDPRAQQPVKSGADSVISLKSIGNHSNYHA
jgi:hypothetical protein